MRHVKFVVLTSSRTGSTWLVDLLNTQPGIETHGELFLKHGRLSPAIAGRADYCRFVDTYDNSSVWRVPRVFTYLNEFYRAPRTVGFKLMYSQLRRYPEILAYFAFRRVRIVHLVRLNLIDVIVSDELARLTGTSHVQTGKISGVPKVHVDAASLVDRVSKLSENTEVTGRLARLCMCPIIGVTYEALLDGEAEFTRILKFLDMPEPASRPKSVLTKRGSGSHRDSIENYDEIRQILMSTRFLQMLR